jgi:hypothetical protein
VVLLLEGDLVSWSRDIDERDEHKNLRGSNRWSVIPYVHERTGVVLFKSALPESAFLSAPCEEVSTRSF